jgi:NAD-dependent dihydropyrimidine dehydrogenase PreA subunit
MTVRKFIKIDEKKCNGCGECVTSCVEGALQIIDGKAKVVNEIFCDGLGACIGSCPQNALEIIEKDVADFDEKAVEKHLENKKHDIPCGCPGMAMKDFSEPEIDTKVENPKSVPSRLKQWPIQLHLVNPAAPYFKNANLVIAASCTAFSFGAFHQEFLANHRLVIACPKLDKTEGYIEKLAQIIKENNLASITVVRMEVPCCAGLTILGKQAIANSGKKVPFLEQVISIQGKLADS